MIRVLLAEALLLALPALAEETTIRVFIGDKEIHAPITQSNGMICIPLDAIAPQIAPPTDAEPPPA